ncbi:MAG: GntR family transcriptional regulator [Flavobacteriales bacterium]|jgi:GntR family transcriptional regulator
MQITIDIDDPVPIFAQLVEQIKQAIAGEKIKPGDPLPSIRQLANDLDVNSKTVSKAYKLLERDAVIQTRGYRGTFVHPKAINNCQVDLKTWMTSQFEEFISQMREAGVTDSEMRITFSRVLNEK